MTSHTSSETILFIPLFNCFLLLFLCIICILHVLYTSNNSRINVKLRMLCTITTLQVKVESKYTIQINMAYHSIYFIRSFHQTLNMHVKINLFKKIIRNKLKWSFVCWKPMDNNYDERKQYIPVGWYPAQICYAHLNDTASTTEIYPPILFNMIINLF